MIRQVRPDEAGALEAFLSQYLATSMFLRSNLAAHGIGGAAHPHATIYHRCPEDGPIRAIFGRSNGGGLMMQAPFGCDKQALSAYVDALQGHTLVGLTGAADQTLELLAELGWQHLGNLQLDKVEPLYRLELVKLAATPARLVRPSAANAPRLTDWFEAYLQETGLPMPGFSLRQAAEQRCQSAIEADDVGFLVRQGVPVAMAALNAKVGSAVQVGGVFVPQGARNQGFGRQVTQALLAGARDKGATDAYLSANNAAACRAYEAIGFGRIGDYRIALLHAPVTFERSLCP
jgi:ribosomal protein S18 acetylase RimI-like enzyme